MFTQVRSAATFGVDAYMVAVETNIDSTIPKFYLVGLPDNAVRADPDAGAQFRAFSDNRRRVNESCHAAPSMIIAVISASAHKSAPTFASHWNFQTLRRFCSFLT